jgi:tetratricopeptide (TPR) repeat protein
LAVSFQLFFHDHELSWVPQGKRIQRDRSRWNLPSLCSLFRNLENAVACFSILLACSATVAGQSASDEVNKGVEAYKSAHYADAIVHFQKATELDPNLPMARGYLATALAQNVVPGLDTPENLKTAHQAIDVFQQVLANDPHDINSMKQIAGIYFSIKQLDAAKAWQKKVLDENPSDPEAAYTIGVVDWTLAHQNSLKALSSAGLQDDGMGNTDALAGVMQSVKVQNSALVEEAVQHLKQAIANRPNYDDAMAYLNLVYRRKADLDWDNDDARKDDIAQAEEWRNKAMETRRANEQKRTSAPNSPQP